MGQLTKEFCEQMLADCDKGQHPSLTVWEHKQLALAWLDREDIRAERDALRGLLREVRKVAKANSLFRSSDEARVLDRRIVAALAAKGE